MNDFLLSWITLAGIFTVVLASPGPDFIMAIRNSILYSRKAGIFTAIGFGLGVMVHVFYCIAGIAVVISQSLLLFNALKWAGAAYLCYVGFKALRSKGLDQPIDAQDGQKAFIPPWKALRSGFLTNLLNPKATIFFLALFTQIISPDALLWQKAAYGATCVVMTILWFSLVSVVLTTPAIRGAFLKASRWIDRVCGVLFIALGVKLAVTKLG